MSSTRRTTAIKKKKGQKKNGREIQIIDDFTIEQWLHGVKSGGRYGERFGHIFKASGFTHMSDLANLDDKKLEQITHHYEAEADSRQ